jgi:large subunit ribosomal protein L17
MRHKKKFNHLGRQRGHRKAMLANMASSLIVHKRIKTTTAKAKALKAYIEPLITKSKDDTTHSRRQVFSYLQDKDATSELFREVAVKVGERPGGYTRIIKLGNRLGDNADICIIELVDFNETLLAEKAAASKASRRRRGGKKKSEDAVEVDTAVAEQELDAEVVATEAIAEVEAPVEEVVAEEVSPAEEKVEAVVEEAVVEEAIVEEAVVEETVAEEKVAEQAPEDAHKEEAPKEEAKAEVKEEEAPKAESKEETPPSDEDKEEKEK